MDMGKILEIMEHVYENEGTPHAKKGELIKKFGDDSYKDFEKFSMGCGKALANETDNGDVRLIPDGLLELRHLKEEASRKTHEQLMILATSLVAIGSIIQTISFVYGQDAAKLFIENGWNIIWGIFLLTMFILIVQAVSDSALKPLFRRIRKKVRRSK